MSSKNQNPNEVIRGVLGGVFIGFFMLLWAVGIIWCAEYFKLPPSEISAVRDRQILIERLKAYQSGEKFEVNAGNKEINKMPMEKIIALLKQSKEDEEKMLTFFAPESKRLETPRELERDIESALSDTSSVTDEEFEAILKTATTGDLKNYLKITDKESDFSKGSDE